MPAWAPIGNLVILMKFVGSNPTDFSDFAPQELEPILIPPLEAAAIDIVENRGVSSDDRPLVLKSLPLEVGSQSAKDHSEHSALRVAARNGTGAFFKGLFIGALEKRNR